MEQEIRRLEQRVSDLEFQLRSQQRYMERILNKIGGSPDDVDLGRHDRMRQQVRYGNAGMGH